MRSLHVRNILRLVHLYLGLTVGLIFVVTGLTGSVLAFYNEIDLTMHAETRAVDSGARPRTYESVYQALRAAHPDRLAYWRIELPDDGGVIAARSLSEADLAGLQFAPLVAWVDPDGPAVVRSAFWGSSDYFFTWIYDLHYRLLLGNTGGIILGFIGLIVLVLVIAGFFLWWPRGNRFRGAFWFRPTKPAHGRIYELHNLLGFYSVIFLVVVVTTGTMITLPTYVRPILAQFSELRTPPSVRSTPVAGRTRVTVDTALRAAQAEFPTARPKWIDTPAGNEGVYHFRFYQDGEPSRRFPQTEVWVDQYSGAVLARRDPMREGAGDTIVTWLHGLHVGEAFGLPGRLLVLLLGLVPLVMFVTGTLYWMRKRTRHLD